jgi:hypothetical protein
MGRYAAIVSEQNRLADPACTGNGWRPQAAVLRPFMTLWGVTG